MFRNPKPILKAYYDIYLKDRILFDKLPELHIPYKKDEVQFFIPDIPKIFLYDVLTESEYDDLLHTCGLAICISTCEGFCHCVNEAMSAGCNLILSNIKPFHELTSQALWGYELQIIEHPICLGSIMDTSSQSIRSALTTYTETSLKHKKNKSELIRQEYEKRHRKFIQLKFPEIPEFHLDKLFIAESNLPCISIVTLTYNRPEFIPLAKYSYLIQSYPSEKLEWVIVNDGESIEELLIGIPNVKYIEFSQVNKTFYKSIKNADCINPVDHVLEKNAVKYVLNDMMIISINEFGKIKHLILDENNELIFFLKYFLLKNMSMK
jgi:hypothetical protein